MNAIRFDLADQPSNSKGYGRYKAPGAKVKSRTGNEWVSASHDGEAEGVFTVTIEVELTVGKGGRFGARKERSSETFALVAAEGESATLKFYPGSQGVKLVVTGARLA